jgi:hypothetical protein
MMALGKNKPTVAQKAQGWMNAHNNAACLGIGAVTAASLIGMFLFIAFSGFGASADFIYNQF